MLPSVPQLKSTLSHVSPDKAALIRSAVTGALKRSAQSGLFCFEQTVETTFVLPWDLDPKVQPQKLSTAVRDGIRTELLDSTTLQHLEACAAINWSSTMVWQCRAQGIADSQWMSTDQSLCSQLEAGYSGGPVQWSFLVGFTTFQVDYNTRRLLNTSSNALFEIRRLALAPLMPMKTEHDSHSLFHAASLGFWGVHDRTALLSQAVTHTLADPKAQFLIYECWSTEISRSVPAGTRPGFPHWEAAKENLTGAPQLHLFTLANIVQRPIIVYAHPECTVGGIYLPLLWESAPGCFLCHTHPHLRNPLALGYDASCNHFTPLVTFKGSRGPDPILLPLVYPSGQSLRIHFLSEMQAQGDSVSLLSQLMLVDLYPPEAHSPSTPPANVLQVQTAFGGDTAPQFGKAGGIPPSPVLPPTLVAISTASEMPEVMDSLVKRYQSMFL